MKFGRIRDDAGELSAPLLPPEHPSTTHLLNDTDRHGMDHQQIHRALELFPPEDPVVRIGLSTWGDKSYRGVLYPADAEPGDFLEHYGRIFSAVELSATFYGMPERARLAAWRDTVPETFRFVPKVSQSLTHRRGLADAQQGLREFLDHTAILGEQRGPLLLQMPPRFAPTPVSYDRLAAALSILGRRAAVELRHPAWFTDRVGDSPEERPDERGAPPAVELLREYGAALVVTDTLGARRVVHTILTAPVLVLRFVAAGDAALDGARIDQWTRQILDWLDRGLREVYLFVHLDDARGALRLAERFSAGLASARAIVRSPRSPDPAELYAPGSEAGMDSNGGERSGSRGERGTGSRPGRSDRPGDGSSSGDSHGQLSLF
ncbi:MAG: DUF72 domain-containing protein [Alkalispirochaeta sp.]